MSKNKNTMVRISKVSRNLMGAAGLAVCITVYAEIETDKPVDGGQLYNTYCAVCHKSGLNAAPKYTNKILWGKVVAKGRDKVYENAINGIRGMPPRGGISGLTDEEVKAATDYMVNGSGGWGGN